MSPCIHLGEEMMTTKKEKVRLQGRVNPDVVKRFKEYVLSSYGKLYGVFGRELEKAVLQYLESKPSTHTQGIQLDGSQTQTDTISLVDYRATAWNRLLHWLKKDHEDGEIPGHRIRDWIRKNVGWDKRTLDKYFSRLKAEGIIKQGRWNKLINCYIYKVHVGDKP